MVIEVKTAVDGCADYCDAFRISTTKLFSNNDKFYYTHKCENLEKCEAILKSLEKTFTVKAENL